MQNSVPSSPPKWLLRISEVFSPNVEEIIRGLGAEPIAKLGGEYHLVHLPAPRTLKESDAGKYVRWNLPVYHSWPCNPQKMEGFIEKAAQALVRKFGIQPPQDILIGRLDPNPADRYYKSLASNLRGRTLQLFPNREARDVEEQDASAPTLFCLVGPEGLFCGLHTPQDANGFYPGGTKYISQSAPGTISRAGAKIAESLHYLRLYRSIPHQGSHWLELGASPGGMTSELLERGYQVTAVDRAPLDQRLAKHKGLRFSLADVATFMPGKADRYQAILSDMNGDAEDAIRHLIRLSASLRPGGLIIFTLKTPGAETFAETNALYHAVLKLASDHGLRLFAKTHLTYNRQEFTLFFEKAA